MFRCGSSLALSIFLLCFQATPSFPATKGAASFQVVPPHARWRRQPYCAAAVLSQMRCPKCRRHRQSRVFEIHSFSPKQHTTRPPPPEMMAPWRLLVSGQWSGSVSHLQRKVLEKRFLDVGRCTWLHGFVQYGLCVPKMATLFSVKVFGVVRRLLRSSRDLVRRAVRYFGSDPTEAPFEAFPSSSLDAGRRMLWLSSVSLEGEPANRRQVSSL